MYYTTDKNTRFAPDVQVAPRPWYWSDSDDHLKIIEDHSEEHTTNGEMIFVFDDGRAIKVYYETNWDEADVWWYYENIPLKTAPKWMHKRRDWM